MAFIPTSAMYRTRANLHRSCSPDQAVSLTPMSQLLVNYIRPTPMLQIRKWLEKYKEEFWEWLITPPASDGQDIEARDLAYKAINEILSLSTLNEETNKPDIVIAKMKIEAARMLLANKGPMIAIQNNVNDETIPPGLRAKTSHQLEQRLHQITRHIPEERMLTIEKEPTS